MSEDECKKIDEKIASLENDSARLKELKQKVEEVMGKYEFTKAHQEILEMKGYKGVMKFIDCTVKKNDKKIKKLNEKLKSCELKKAEG